MKAIRDLNDWNLVEELARPGLATAILFYGTEHFRSNVVRHSFLDVALKHEGHVSFCRINVDENPSVTAAQSIKTLPTIILYIGGKEVRRRVGSQGPKEITQLISRKQDKP